MEWYYPNRVLYIEYRGSVTLEDINHVFSQLYTYMAEADSTIHCIIDISNANNPLLNLKLVKDSSIIQQVMNHPKSGWGVYCNSSGNHLLNFFGSVLVQSFRLGKLKFVASKEEAFHFLQTIDDDIQGDPLAL